MKHKKATNKQILDAYGQSYRLMQEAKRYADEKIKKDSRCKQQHGENLKSILKQHEL